MRFMICAMDIYHCPGVVMRPDYLSRLGADLCLDKLSHKYLNYTSNLRKLHPPTTGTMLPENMYGCRGPIMRSAIPVDSSVPVIFGAFNPPGFEVDYSIAPILSTIKLDFSGGHYFNLHT